MPRRVVDRWDIQSALVEGVKNISAAPVLCECRSGMSVKIMTHIRPSVPPVLVVAFLFFGIPAIIILPFMLIDKYVPDSQNTPGSTLYADPTRDYLNSQESADSASLPDTSWMTPYPSGYLLTPENLSAILSGTPAKITPATTQEPMHAVETNTPAPTWEPTQTASTTPSPTLTPSPTENPIYLTSTALVEQAKVTAAVGQAIKTAQSKADFWALGRFMIKVVTAVIAAGIIVIVIMRLIKDYKIIKAEMDNHKKLEEIKANPWLVYPEAVQFETEQVYKLIGSIIEYCKSEAINPLDFYSIPRYTKLPGWEKKSNEWVSTTNFLHNRGYIIKMPRKATGTKKYSVWQIKLIVEQGLYLERDIEEKLVEYTPSENRNLTESRKQ